MSLPFRIAGYEPGIDDVTDVGRYMDLQIVKLDSPERRLLVAVMRDAVHILTTTARSNRSKIPYKDTVKWFLRRNRNEPFSFLYVCDSLNIRPSLFLRRLKVYL